MRREQWTRERPLVARTRPLVFALFATCAAASQWPAGGRERKSNERARSRVALFVLLPAKEEGKNPTIARGLILTKCWSCKRRRLLLLLLLQILRLQQLLQRLSKCHVNVKRCLQQVAARPLRPRQIWLRLGGKLAKVGQLAGAHRLRLHQGVRDCVELDVSGHIEIHLGQRGRRVRSDGGACRLLLLLLFSNLLVSRRVISSLIREQFCNTQQAVGQPCGHKSQRELGESSGQAKRASERVLLAGDDKPPRASGLQGSESSVWSDLISPPAGSKFARRAKGVRLWRREPSIDHTCARVRQLAKWRSARLGSVRLGQLACQVAQDEPRKISLRARNCSANCWPAC